MSRVAPTDLSICWTLKSSKNDKIHKIRTQQIQVRVCFLREPKRRRQLRHSHKGLAGPEIVNSDKIRKIHTIHKSRNVFFLRSLRHRRQLQHRCTGLGDPNTGKNLHVHKLVQFPKLKHQNVEICIGAFSMRPTKQISEMSEHPDFPSL